MDEPACFVTHSGETMRLAIPVVGPSPIDFDMTLVAWGRGGERCAVPSGVPVVADGQLEFWLDLPATCLLIDPHSGI